MGFRLIARAYDPAGHEVHPEREYEGDSPQDCALKYAQSLGVFGPRRRKAATSATGPDDLRGGENA